MAATQGGALAEFGKRPLGQKVGIFAGIAALLLLLYFQFMLRPLQKKLKAQAAMNTQLQQEGEDLDDKIANINELLKKRAQLDKQLEEDRSALPTEAELPSFFDTLNRKVGDAGVEVKRWEYKREEPVEDFYRVPVEIELTGTFQQLKRFFASLLPHDDGAGADLPSEKERIITIENLTLSDPTPKNGEIVLTAKFTASTFRQDEAKKTPAAPGAAAAPAKPATPPTPPPAGAGSGSGSGGKGLTGQVKDEVHTDMQMSKDRAGSAHPDGNAKLKGGM
jgi:type IV pilus assembly protein PilO